MWEFPYGSKWPESVSKSEIVGTPTFCEYWTIEFLLRVLRRTFDSQKFFLVCKMNKGKFSLSLIGIEFFQKVDDLLFPIQWQSV
ncbi:hypothetical protein [Leptospira santarosai]|uniref:hypothetical protein n=1 Tax=Leptospira santarosai TaxID=28183 RepID=UPI0009B60516